jgi:hypothetical protein
MPDAIETIEYKDHIIEIHHDDCPESPLEWDLFGSFEFFNSRYGSTELSHLLCNAYDMRQDKLSARELANLCLKHGGREAYRDWAAYMPNPKDRFLNISEFVWEFASDHTDGSAEFLIDRLTEMGWIIKPMTTCRFQAGITECDPERADAVVYASPSKILSEFGGDVERALNCIESEIETYNQWAAGEVYGYEIKRITYEDGEQCIDEDTVDSCWGCYGWNYCMSEAKLAVDQMEVSCVTAD